MEKILKKILFHFYLKLQKGFQDFKNQEKTNDNEL
jgi:hypothetical protein